MSTAKPATMQTGDMKSSLSALAEAARGESPSAEPAAWTLPSGEDLLHYALNGGFLAPGILGSSEESQAESRGARRARNAQVQEKVR